MIKKKMLRVWACVFAVLMLLSVVSSFGISANAADVQTGKLRVEVTGGAGFTISVDGSAARPQGAVYHNSKIAVGASVTLAVKEIDGATFLGWMNPTSGVIVSDALSYSFIASGNDYYNAMYSSQIEGVQMVAFKNEKAGYYGKILDMQYYCAGDSIVFPADPTQVGFDFAGWSMTEEEIKSAVANGQDAMVTAEWTKAIVPVEVTVNGGSGSGTYNANNQVTISANEAPAGQKFAYWTDDEGNVRSYDTTYSFFPSKDTTLTAVFVAEDTVIDYQILVSVDSIDTTTIADKNVFYYSWYCPDSYDFVKAGILAVNKDNYNEATMVAGTSDSNVYDRSPSGDNLIPVNTYTWSKSNVTSGQTWMARAYVQYRDAQGQIVTVYSDVTEATKD
ncbi:MAG: InlB B-repeat-containing protein [Ruminococcus sp.]|nr:InlB B-repeat-containing protein [Ruminococcus sp.]